MSYGFRSPGFGLSLVAESTKGTLLSAEGASKPADQEGAVSPEDIGRKTAMMLLEEIYRVRFLLYLIFHEAVLLITP